MPLPLGMLLPPSFAAPPGHAAPPRGTLYPSWHAASPVLAAPLEEGLHLGQSLLQSRLVLLTTIFTF
jgi:hypothetical protein